MAKVTIIFSDDDLGGVDVMCDGDPPIKEVADSDEAPTNAQRSAALVMEFLDQFIAFAQTQLQAESGA